MHLILKTILFVIGLLFSFAAGGLAFRSLRRHFTWCSAEGSVDRIDEVGGRRTMFCPSVHFLTRDGDEITFSAEMATSYRKYRIGESGAGVV